MIPLEDYKKIISTIPILCIDIVLENQEGQYLLFKRTNEPLKGEWWVLGGRVLQGETLKDAALRKLKEEAGLTDLDLECIGVYEDFFDRNSFDLDTLYHTVSIVFKAKLSSKSTIQLDSQSDDWKFSKTLPERFTLKALYLKHEAN